MELNDALHAPGSAGCEFRYQSGCWCDTEQGIDEMEDSFRKDFVKITALLYS
jgi:hypothetical protein